MSISSVPSLPVLGLAVNADQILVTDVASNAIEAPLTNRLACSAVNVQPVDLSHYGYKMVLMSVLQNLDPTFLPSDIQRNHVQDVVASMGRLDSTTAV